MPARDLEKDEVTADIETAADVAPPESATASEKFTDGEIPAVAAGAAAGGATASELAFDGKAQQPTGGDYGYLDSGIHTDWEFYKADCEASGRPDKWKPEYRMGYTSAKQFDQPFEHRQENEFVLQKGQSASQAVQDFLAGPTITDYRAASVANDLDELRDMYGDQKFDKLFGSADSSLDVSIPENQRMRISSAAYTTPLIQQMQAIADALDQAESSQNEEPDVAVAEARVEEKPNVPQLEQEPTVVAQELGLQQQDRELA